VKNKKSNKANLEDKRIIFLELGFIVTQLICLAFLEWRSTPSYTEQIYLGLPEMEFEEEVIPITRQEYETPKVDAVILARSELDKAQGKLAGPNILRIVDNAAEISDELTVGDQEADQTTQVAIVDIEDVVIEEEEEEEEVFFIVEEMPTFNGGDLREFQKYCQQNLVYPEIAMDNDITGTVIIQFVVNKKGEVVQAKVARSVDPSLDKEALRVVNSSPKWTPGKQRNVPANVSFTVPIRFMIADRLP
jgi:protein TonB